MTLRKHCIFGLWAVVSISSRLKNMLLFFAMMCYFSMNLHKICVRYKLPKPINTFILTAKYMTISNKYANPPISALWVCYRTKGETTHQTGAKQLTGETTQGETTQGKRTHGQIDLWAKRLTGETTRYHRG